MTYTYDETRDNEQLRLLTPAIDDFINRYQNPPPSSSTCPRQTVFFFPGGMASQLKRATQKFQDGIATPQIFNYDVVWLDWNTPLYEWRYLEMHRDSTGGFRDKGNHLIVADGSVNLLGCTPHDGLIDWCAKNNVDLFVFNWDWRRRLDETVRFFLDKFLPFFSTRVTNAGCPNALAKFSLVGHSFGGMIVNLILRDNVLANANLVSNVKCAITVATPFYGYPGQVHRWFEGDESLLSLWGPFGSLIKQDLIEVISSLPGLYVLHFLDEVTFDDNATHQGLTQDPEFPLNSYPSMDKTAATLRADPYNPLTNGGLVRYPSNTGFDLAELARAKGQFQQLAGPMGPDLLQKFYNIRGVQTEADEQTEINDTAGSATCDWIQPNFDSRFDPSPIADSGWVAGDDTQPAWSARLATNNPARCITVKASDLNHVFLMSHHRTLDAIGTILCAPGAAMSAPVTPQPAPASAQEVIDFLSWLASNRLKLPRRIDRETLVKQVPARFKKRLGPIARRFLMDIVRGPAPRKARTPRGGKPKAAAPRKKAAKTAARRPRSKSRKK